MHIAVVTPEYPTPQRPEGGLGNYVRKLGHELVRRGHAFSVLVPGLRADQWTDRSIRVRVVRVPLRARLARLPVVGPITRQLWTAWLLAGALSRLHDQQPVDIVLTSSYQAAGVFVRRRTGVPLVCRVSSYAPLLRVAEGRHRRFADHLTDYLEVKQVALADAAFVPSAFMADTYRRFEGLSLKVVRTPVEDLESPGEPPQLPDRITAGPYLVFFGTLNRVKGADLVAEVAGELLRQHDTLSLVLIGRDDGLPGVPSIVDDIRRRAGSAADRLVHLPPQTRDVWIPVVTQALAVLMPSRVDNYPNACLEVLSAGTPVVATTGSSIDEIVEDAVNGVLVPNEDAVALRDAIEGLLALSDEEHERLRRRARQSMRAAADEDRIGQVEQLLAYAMDATQGRR